MFQETLSAGDSSASLAVSPRPPADDPEGTEGIELPAGVTAPLWRPSCGDGGVEYEFLLDGSESGPVTTLLAPPSQGNAYFSTSIILSL